MTKHQEFFTVRASVAAVRGALLTLAMLPAAYAVDPEVAELTQPSSTVEIGVTTVSKDSYKFGEYNGLEHKGATANLGFDLRGGAVDSDVDATRFRITATNLGLQNRNLSVEYGEQGKYRLTFKYDELLRNYSDSYQTPYSGTGTSTLTLPFYPAAATRLSATTTANGALTNWANLQAPNAAIVGGVPSGAGPGVLIPANMHDFNVKTLRTKESVDVSLMLSPQWELKASASHERKDGTKLTGVAFGGPARGTLLPEPINSDTDLFKVGLVYVDGTSHLNLGYYGSFYRNDTNLWTVQNPFQGTLLAAAFRDSASLSGAPDNQMHRLSLSGGYNFSNTTRLVVAGNYQRMTQNESFALSGLPATWSVGTSANAKVINSSFSATLTARPVKDVSLLAGYKYENRDNKTPMRDYLYAGGNAASAPSLFSNDPLNRRMQQFDLSADWTFARREALKASYQWQEIRRTSDSVDTPIRAEKTRENTLGLEYRNNLSQDMTGRIGYSYSDRRHSDYEDSALLAAPVVAPSPANDPLLPGFIQFWLADRHRDKLRSVLNFQATEAVTIQTGLDYNRDKFTNSQYGLKESNSWVFKLDSTYAASEALSLSAFYTFEDKKSRMDSLAISRGTAGVTILDAGTHTPGVCTGYFAATGHLPADEGTDPCRQWSETQSDRIHTIGFSFKALDVMHNGKLDLGGDLVYSKARTPISMTGGAYYGNGSTAAAPAFNNIWIAAQSFPDITSQMIDLRLTGTYTIDKSSAVRVNYLYRRLKSNDWQYDAYTNSALGAVAISSYIGTGMTSPNYAVNVISVSYLYTFK